MESGSFAAIELVGNNESMLGIIWKREVLYISLGNGEFYDLSLLIFFF